MRDMQPAQRLYHRLHAVVVGGDGEHAKRFPSEMLLVLFPGMGRQVGPHFFFEAGLSKGIRSHHRHRAAVDLDREMAARAVGEREPEHEIRHEPHFVVDAPMRERDVQREWITAGNALVREGGDELSGVNELHVRRARARSSFNFTFARMASMARRTVSCPTRA